LQADKTGVFFESVTIGTFSKQSALAHKHKNFSRNEHLSRRRAYAITISSNITVIAAIITSHLPCAKHQDRSL